MKERVLHFLEQAMIHKASDIYIVARKPVTLKISGRMVAVDKNALSEDDCAEILKQLYALGRNRSFDRLKDGDDDFAIGIDGIGRFRVNAYSQSQSYASIIRTIPLGLPDPAKINIPDVIVNLANFRRGIVLFTGTTGSGKSTSLACLIDKINSTRDDHIITIEDPVEFRHPHKMGIVSQRELDADTRSYSSALRAAMRQVPEVILVGEMRDHETISAAITAAETGHLVFGTLHTNSAAQSIDRMVNVFPPHQQPQVKAQLGNMLQAICSQRLVPAIGGGRLAAAEIMIANSAVRNIIREGKSHQLDSVIQTSAQEGMQSMDRTLVQMVRSGQISYDEAKNFAVDLTEFERMMKG